MGVEALIADLKERGIRLIADPPRLIAEPASKLTDEDRAAIRTCKAALMDLLSTVATACSTVRGSQMPEVIDLTIRRAGLPADHQPELAAIEFPLCPDCGQRRYWLAQGGRVACSICGRVIWQITRMEFHAFA